uniref:BTB domain-containing protein n=1 Tax=Panagrolaimus sp. ES5 TaxID=591445 RepID=A0AC34FE87_9BILA
MDANKNLSEIQKKIVKVFKAQDPETSYFDVCFEIDGKLLYADRFRLSLISPTFQSMLSDRWTSKNEPIKIKDYSFEDFKEFLTFIYSGECNLTIENIATMVDIAEFYQINIFKNACDKFLSKIKFTLKNMFQLLELANKYSMTNLKESLNIFISKNCGDLINLKEFQSLKKSTMKDIVEASRDSLRSEELFGAVFKWAENRAMKRGKCNDNLNEAIKEEFSEILPFINFRTMNVEFIINFVVLKSFLFTGPELRDILLSAWGKVYVRVIDSNEKILKGILDCPDIDKVVAVIKSQKNVLRHTYWKTNQPKPSTPSKLNKNDEIELYLVYDIDGDLALKRRNCIKISDYILAEMFAEDGFIFDNTYKKIEVYHCA